MATKKRTTKIKRESSTDIQERAVLLTALQDHLELKSGTQAKKAKDLDITQPRLNDLLKNRIDKFSLDALVILAVKAGLRVNMKVQPVHIPGLGSITPNQGRLLSVFAPAPSELGKLDSTLGTSVFLSLLRCEVIANGLSPKDVVLSLNINTKDGGIDAKVENSSTSTSLLAKGDTFYQIKTGPSFKPWQPAALKAELFGKSKSKPSKKTLGKEIKHCLDNDGTYALVTFGHDLLSDQHSSTVKELVKLLKACGYENPKVCVYGQGQLVGELDKYPSICLDLIGLADGGFQSLSGWRGNAQMRLSLELGDDQIALVKDIQATLQEDVIQYIRLVGEPGIGKTRLVLEAVSVDEIASSVIYVPTGEEFQKSKLFNELLKPDRQYSITLVIDDCDSRNSTSIWAALKGRSGIKLIAIDHGSEETHDSAMRVFACPVLEDEQIKNILSGYVKNNSDLHNWVETCGGSPRVAHAIGENLKSNPDDILKSPADVPIWDRFIIGHKEMSSREAEQYRVVLRHVALFQRFGFESPVNMEAQYICTLVQEVDPTITWGRFQTIVQHYRNKRILQGSHTLFIVPKALHLHLWVEFWVKHGRGFQFEVFLEKIPAGMKRWFLELFIYAHAAEPAKDIVKNLLSVNGVFANDKFLKSEEGLRFLRYLSEADPSSTLALLERTIGAWSHEELLGWTLGRQNIVWALEKIVVWDDLFVRAANLLTLMALAENAKNSNNSKGLLSSLFGIGLGWAPTQASPSKRLPILKDLVISTDASRRALGLELCQQWLSTYGGSRIIGAENQGLKPTIEFWRPKTYEEVFKYWREVLYFLRDEMKGYNVADRNRAADILVGAVKGLVNIADMATDAIDIMFDIVSDDEINRKSITEFVIWELREGNENIDRDIRDKILDLDKLLAGESLWDRINRYVLHTNWTEDRAYRDTESEELDVPSMRVQELAKEYMSDLSVFSEQLPKLMHEGGHRLPEFGVECGKLSQPEFIEEIYLSVKSNFRDANCVFFGGYLWGLRDHDKVLWEAQLHRLLNDDKLRDIAVDCICRSGFTESVLQRLLDLLCDGFLTSKAFEQLTFNPERNNISVAMFHDVISTLLQHPDNTSASVCVELVHDYYVYKGSSEEFPEQLVLDVLTATPLTEDQEQMYEYHWSKIAERFLSQYPSHNIALFTYVLNNMARISRYGGLSHVAKIADDIVKAFPTDAWSIVSKLMSEENKKRYDIIHWLGDTGFEDNPEKGAINNMPANEIMSWLKEDIDERLWLVREVLPKTLDKNRGGQLTCLFIEQFCDDERVSGSLFAHFHMGGWSGPESSYLSRKRDLARQWMVEIASTKVQLWLGKYIDYLNDAIEAKKISEERGF